VTPVAVNLGLLGMQRLLLTTLALLLLAALTVGPGDAVECTAEEFGKAVNDAGAALRKLSAENTPRLQAKMEQLKTKMKWPDAGYEDRAYQALQDERVSAFDNDANSLLAKIDALGTVEPGGAPECGKLQELQAASLELQATVKTKTAYLISKLDQMLSDAPIAAAPKPKAAEPKARAPETKVATAEPTFTPAPALPPAPRQPAASGWSTNTTGNAPPGEVAATPLPPLPQPPPGPAAPADAEGYTIEEIRTASAGFFGQVSANLGSVIEHLFSKSGRPTGYILGTEGGGAFLAGVRYGKGTLYLRNGGTQPIFWHGPSVGFDVGGEGSKTLFLIYKMTTPEVLFASFTGIDGSAYLVGGVGATLVTNGTVVMAPIRSGIGLRLGANLGYIRFTPKGTWNPF
jgi:hypothetical protein